MPEPIKNPYLPILKAAILMLCLAFTLLFITLYIGKGCSNKPRIADNKAAKIVIDSLDKKDKATEIKQIPIVKKIDSLALLINQLKVANNKLYKAGRVTIINNICNKDSILNAYDSLYNSCEVETKAHNEAINAWRYLDSLKQLRLDVRDLKIVQYKSIIKSDSLVIDSLTHSKKKYWRGFKHGLLVGAGASTIIYGSVIGR